MANTLAKVLICNDKIEQMSELSTDIECCQRLDILVKNFKP